MLIFLVTRLPVAGSQSLVPYIPSNMAFLLLVDHHLFSFRYLNMILVFFTSSKQPKNLLTVKHTIAESSSDYQPAALYQITSDVYRSHSLLPPRSSTESQTIYPIHPSCPFLQSGFKIEIISVSLQLKGSPPKVKIWMSWSIWMRWSIWMKWSIWMRWSIWMVINLVFEIWWHLQSQIIILNNNGIWWHKQHGRLNEWLRSEIWKINLLKSAII